jgi:CheY-like chemotaxis protein/two-component sensor histidine kinase
MEDHAQTPDGRDAEIQALQDRIRELEERLRAARATADSGTRAKDEFLAMLGHELRNPLAPILTALHLMKLQGPEGSERARNVIERQVKHLARLVEDLLDVSRIARGQVALELEPTELASVVAGGIEMAGPLLEQHAHTLVVDVPRHGLVVDGDSARLAQVVSNLLANAAKYTPPSGRITLRAWQEGDQVVLSVADTGIGMAPDVLPRVFDVFVQGRQSIDRSQGGLGIGLTIVRNLVERHGGTVSARSGGLGQGSEFVVRLRRSANDRLPRGTGAGGPASLARSGIRILIVDDNVDAAATLTQALTHLGYHARFAHDAPTALRVADELRPDIAFLDLGLPVMDGYELAARLRALPGLAGMHLVALTGYGQDADRARTLHAGFHHHLVKPVAMEELEAVIRRR